MSLTDQNVGCVRSPKGTGKTVALGEVATGQRILVLTHRAQLGTTIRDRVGLETLGAEVPDAQS